MNRMHETRGIQIGAKIHIQAQCVKPDSRNIINIAVRIRHAIPNLLIVFPKAAIVI